MTTKLYRLIRLHTLLLLVLSMVTPRQSHADIETNSSLGSLEIRGSGAMGQLARTIAEQFMAEHPGTIVTVQTCGANQGIKALIVGTCQIAMGTNEIPEELEKLARANNVKLKRTDVYRDAIAVIVNPANPIRSLTLKQIRDIFRGAVTNWQEVGGSDAPIEVLTPHATSAAYEVFKRRVLGDESVITPKAAVIDSRQVKERLSVTSITYVGLSQAANLGLPEMTVDGVSPSTATVQSGKYPIVREMSLYQLAPSTTLGDQVVEYFLAPDKGQKFIAKAGNVPVK